MELSKDEIKRYSRHLIMPEVGLAGQKKLKNASVLCIGTGGLGSPLTLYLAAAGVGRLGLVDCDVVDVSNLQRQILHHTSDIGRSKLESATEKLRAINPTIQIETYETMLDSENAMEICTSYNIIADGTDNFPTRYLANDVSVLLKKPNVHASIFRFEGQASVFHAEKGPCYRCLYPEPPPPGEVPSCAEGGVFGILPGLLGIIQATEVIKLILGIGDPLIGRLLMVDALQMRTRELQIEKDPNCPICGTDPTIRELIKYEQFCGFSDSPKDHEATQSQGVDVSAHELHAMVHLDKRPVVLLDVREPHEWDICRIEGALHIPLDLLPQRVHELDSADEIIVYCLGGVRSRRAVNFLHEAGFRKLRNLAGGIRAWASQVDPDMPTY
jgi:adenylyltransferase/sulfurtransferase